MTTGNTSGTGTWSQGEAVIRLTNGTTFSNPTPTGSYQFYDGTSDGTNNYAVSFSSGAVYRMGLDWSSPTQIFSTGDGSGQNAGITYDGSNNSLWLVKLETPDNSTMQPVKPL